VLPNCSSDRLELALTDSHLTPRNDTCQLPRATWNTHFRIIQKLADREFCRMELGDVLNRNLLIGPNSADTSKASLVISN
jgi:hypothetical protein